MEEVKKCFQVILKALEFEMARCNRVTKIRQDVQKQSQIKDFTVKRL